VRPRTGVPAALLSAKEAFFLSSEPSSKLRFLRFGRCAAEALAQLLWAQTRFSLYEPVLRMVGRTSLTTHFLNAFASGFRLVRIRR